MSDETAGVGPVDGSVRPSVYAKSEDLAQVKGCNGVSVWCENPAIFDADCRPPLSLVPLFDLDELWRVAARAAEIESSKVQAAVAEERERWQADAERYRWLFGARTAEQCADEDVGLQPPTPQDELIASFAGFYVHKEFADAAIDAARVAPPPEVCSNCDTALPKGCGGLFKDDGKHCRLNAA